MSLIVEEKTRSVLKLENHTQEQHRSNVSPGVGYDSCTVWSFVRNAEGTGTGRAGFLNVFSQVWMATLSLDVIAIQQNYAVVLTIFSVHDSQIMYPLVLENIDHETKRIRGTRLIT